MRSLRGARHARPLRRPPGQPEGVRPPTPPRRAHGAEPLRCTDHLHRPHQSPGIHAAHPAIGGGACEARSTAVHPW
jgi:hypothetical protein